MNYVVAVINPEGPDHVWELIGPFTLSAARAFAEKHRKTVNPDYCVEVLAMTGVHIEESER